MKKEKVIMCCILLVFLTPLTQALYFEDFTGREIPYLYRPVFGNQEGNIYVNNIFKLCLSTNETHVHSQSEETCNNTTLDVFIPGSVNLYSSKAVITAYTEGDIEIITRTKKNEAIQKTTNFFARIWNWFR